MRHSSRTNGDVQRTRRTPAPRRSLTKLHNLLDEGGLPVRALKLRFQTAIRPVFQSQSPPVLAAVQAPALKHSA
jgi:hypothetical protein